ncbi:toll/interleukin-1 receptor domain-containing protein [Flexithrix dorotheae]|uniref:toll/interleukin-1 receptor domain-containing protein n=1 Tax=Flexithrix dorotheae TaxID=70993 RepID=UPI00035DF2BC|nr:TIR domain-containing protein [Flexithrix dorotheae]
MEASVSTTIYDAFISYGRKESKHFAQRVKSYLEGENLEVWLDLEDIDVATDWQDRIDKGIASSKNFIFIISPHAINSEYCKKEIDLAIAYNKRIIPILHIERELEKLNPVIGEINFLPIKEKEDPGLPIDQWESIDDFDLGMETLKNKIVENDFYNAIHTHLLLKALEWDKNNQRPAYLLFAQERIQAQKLLDSNRLKDLPNPFSPIHCQYICEARKNAENMMTDVFIAYATEEEEMANAINHALMKNGITTWMDSQDVKGGVDFREAVQEGIEHSDNLLFVISSKSVEEPTCLDELRYAVSLNKRVIPIILEDVPSDKIPEEIKKLKSINLRDNDPDKVKIAKNEKSDFDKDIDELLNQIEQDFEYHHKHKQLLVQGLRWSRMGESDSFLLRGNNLIQSQEWLEAGNRRGIHKPTGLHERFISSSISKIGILTSEVFISYSQKDADFARKLNLKLQSFRKTTWFDQESIASASNFEEEIKNGIAISDNFLFVISPDSLASEFCVEEVTYAAENNKRFITVLIEDVKPEDLPDALKEVQWIDFKRHKFDIAFSTLMHTLNIDREYVREHTRLQQKAAAWREKGGKKVHNFLFNQADKDLLLKKAEFRQFDMWMKKSIQEKKIPTATKLQKDYLKTCSHYLRLRRNALIVAAIIALLIPPMIMAYYFQESREKTALNYVYASEQILNTEHDPIRALSIAKEAYSYISKKSLNKLLPVFRDISNSLSEQTIKLEKAPEEMFFLDQGTDSILVTFTGNSVILRNINGDLLETNPVIQFEYPILEARAAFGNLYVRDQHKQLFAINPLAEDIDLSQTIKADSIQDFIVYEDGEKIFTQFERIVSRVYSKGKESWDWVGTFNHYNRQSPLAGALISPGEHFLLTYARDKSVRFWDFENPQNPQEIRELSHRIRFAEFSSDSTKLLTLLDNNDLLIWEVKDNKIIILKRKHHVKSVRFTHSSNLIVIQNEDKRVSLEEATNDASFFRELITYSQLEGGVDSILLSEDKKTILTYQKSGTAATWGLNGEMIGEVDLEDQEGTTDLITLSPSGKYILRTSLEGLITLWDKKGNEQAVLKAHQTKLRHILFSKTNEKLYTVSEDGILKIWSADDSTFIKKGMHAEGEEESYNLRLTIEDWLKKHQADTLKMAEVDRVRFGIISDYDNIIESEDSTVLNLYANYYLKEGENSFEKKEKVENLERSKALFTRLLELGFGNVYIQTNIADIQLELGEEINFEKLFQVETSYKKLFLTQYLRQKFSDRKIKEKIQAFELVSRLYKEILNDRKYIGLSGNRSFISRKAANNYNSLSYYYILDGDMEKGIELALEGKAMDSTYRWINTKLALGYLYDEQIHEALPVLKEMKEWGNFGVDNYQERMKGYLKYVDSLREKEGALKVKRVVELSFNEIADKDKEVFAYFIEGLAY